MGEDSSKAVQPDRKAKWEEADFRILGFRRLSQPLNRLLFEFFNSGLGGRLAGLVTDAQFGWWKLRHRRARFSDYYAASIANRLKRGGTHKTLGVRRFLSPSEDQIPSSYGQRGLKYFNKLLELGLRPEHVCVDYGCGSLRVGQHLIRYLKPARYQGLDIVDDFYRAGLSLLPPGLIEHKEPRFDLIRPLSLATARQSAPDLIVSFAVLQHVPPRELDEFFSNVLSLMGPTSKVVVAFNESARTWRSGSKIWDYSAADILACIHRQAPGLDASITEFHSRRTGSSDLPHRSILLIGRRPASLQL